jgi:hypothetical protein
MVATDSLQTTTQFDLSPAAAFLPVSTAIDRGVRNASGDRTAAAAHSSSETAAKASHCTGGRPGGICNSASGGAAICRRCTVPRFRPVGAFRSVFRFNFLARTGAATGPEWILRQDGQRRTNWRVLIWRIDAVA